MLTRRTALSLLALAACAPLAAGKTPSAGAGRAGLSPAKIQEIEHSISAEMARMRIPGLSVAIGLGSEVAWSAGFGMADLENSVPARAETMFRLASISKPITAVAVMQLVEKHKIELDAPIQSYVAAFPEKPWPVTVRQLLAHLGGVRHYRDQAEIDSTHHYRGLTDAIGIFRNDPLLFEPGTRYSYTTYGYVLLGAAVEKAAGMRFIDYLKENVFRPAQMDRIRVDDVYDIIPNRARGYRFRPDGVLQNCALADTSNKIPGGGLISTPADLVKFALALDRGLLLNKEAVGQMFAPQRLDDGSRCGYGLGWNILRVDRELWVGHSGAQQGISTFLLLVPKKDVSVAVMANLEGLDLSALTAGIVRVVLE